MRPCYSEPWLCANGYWWDPTTTTTTKKMKASKWPTGGLFSHQNTCLLLAEWEPIISPQVLMNGWFFSLASFHTSILRQAADRPLLSFEYLASFHSVIGVNRIDLARFVKINPGSKAWANDGKCYGLNCLQKPADVSNKKTFNAEFSCWRRVHDLIIEQVEYLITRANNLLQSSPVCRSYGNSGDTKLYQTVCNSVCMFV